MPALQRPSVEDAYTSRPPIVLGSRPRPGTRSATEPGVVPAILARREGSDGAVRCLACAHRCLVRPGRAGVCQVRENRDGGLVSLVYGQAVAATVEPIEKKPLFHFHPGTTAFSIATRGCNFHCRFCQNWEIAQADREGLHPQAVDLPPGEVVRRAVASGARSIAYTFVEPTVFMEYVLDTADLARDAGLANVLVTNGYQTQEALDLLARLVDAANVDLKAFSDRFYRTVCGARLAHVLEALVGMRERGLWVEVTTLVIPGANDDPDDLKRLARWLVVELGPDTPWHVSRFFPAYRMADVPPTPIEAVERAVSIGREAGLRYVYPGNVDGHADIDTTCSGCGRVLIRRRGHAVLENRLVRGACPDCATRLPGVHPR